MTNLLKLTLLSFCSFEFLLALGIKESSIPLWIAFAIFVCLILSRNRDEREKFFIILFSKWAFAVVAIYFIFARAALVVAQYYSFQLNTFDTGIYANLISNFKTTGQYYSSILGMPGLGNHFTPVLMLISPLFSLSSGPLVLMFLKVLSFGLSGYLLFLFSKQELGKDHSLLYVPSMLWFSHKYVNQMMNFEFQPSSLALPFIIGAILFASRNKTWLMLLCLFLCLGFKENLPVAWVGVGAYCWFVKGNRRLGLSLFGLGLAAYVVVRWWLMPEFAQGVAYPHADKFGPFAFLWRKGRLLFEAIFSVGFVPALAPSTFVVTALGFGTALVSKTPEMLTFRYHYQDIGLAILLVTFVIALRQRQITVHSMGRLFPSVLFLVLVGFHSAFPMRVLLKQWPTADHIALGSELAQLKAQERLPGPLCVLDALGPRFYERADLKIIGNTDMAGKSTLCRSILISDLVDPWPLNEDYSTLKGNLEKLVSQGVLTSKVYHYSTLFIHNDSGATSTSS